MRTGDHLPRNGNRPAVGVEIEAVYELPASMDAGAWVDGAEEVPVRGVNGREDRPRPLGGLRRRQMPRHARLRVDGVHDDRDGEPGRRGKPLLGRNVERCDGRVNPQLDVRFRCAARL